jgi:hypothetical protein
MSTKPRFGLEVFKFSLYVSIPIFVGGCCWGGGKGGIFNDFIFSFSHLILLRLCVRRERE